MATIAELDNLVSDDISVSSPEEYVDGGSNRLLPEGTYNFVIRDFEVITPKDDPTKFRGFNLTELEVADGPLAGQRVFQQRIWATPYLRQGAKVSQLGDLIRSIDQTVEWSTPGEAGMILQRAKDQKLPFRAKFGWEAFDQQYFDENDGPNMERKSPDEKALRKESTIRGMKNFRRAADGTPLPEVKGPSGEMLEARGTFNNFIPSGKRR